MTAQLAFSFEAPPAARTTAPAVSSDNGCRQCGHSKEAHRTPDGRCGTCDRPGRDSWCPSWVAPGSSARCEVCTRTAPEVRIFRHAWRRESDDTWQHHWFCAGCWSDRGGRDVCQRCGAVETHRRRFAWNTQGEYPHCSPACGVLELGRLGWCEGCGEESVVMWEREELPGHGWCCYCAEWGAAWWEGSKAFPFNSEAALGGRFRKWPFTSYLPARGAAERTVSAAPPKGG
jgi:hypothetical protein